MYVGQERTGVTARALALDALIRIEDGAFAHILVPELLARSDLEPRDRGFVTELVFGSVRMQRALDFQLDRHASRPLAELEPAVRAALRLGAYQLLIGTPAHAAVAETVEVVTTRARGFVNGVLRSLARAGPPWSWPPADTVTGIAVRTSHPDWIAQLLVDNYGAATALATLAVNDEPAALTLRVNPRRATVAAVEKELLDLGLGVERGALVPDALVVPGSGDVGALAAVREGRATPHDQASQAVVAALDPQPGERVLDVAAAPGGKASACAERMDDTGLVVAADVNPGRVRSLARGLRRLGLDSIQPVVADGRHPFVANDTFDRVLVDAPCSGLGVLRRRPDARWRVRPDDVTALGLLQRELLLAAAATVRPGGRLVYAVCTVSPQETLAIDEFATERLPGFAALTPAGPPWRSHGRGALVLPADARTDGMFVLALQRDLGR
jgi:16S rRNA (cytosine967-C5)-methyltransferase